MKMAFALPVALAFLASAAAGQGTPRETVLTASTLTNPIGMEFVRIPAGTMVVGRFHVVCPAAGPSTSWTAEEVARCEEMAKRDERPGFEVRIDHPFLLGRDGQVLLSWHTEAEGFRVVPLGTAAPAQDGGDRS